ncbi:MAG: TonB-dependent receptor [Saprospiraceae bacterium]
MLTKRFKFSFFILMFFYHIGWTQNIVLDSLTLLENRVYGYGVREVAVDSVGIQFLSNTLSSLNTGQFRQSSPGGLASLLYRGFSNRHIPVVWNGLNIQSTTNGSFDLCLLPQFSFHNVHFSNNFRSSLLGNNTFSGGWVFDKKQKEVPFLFIETDASSLQNFGLNIGLQLKQKKSIFNLGFIQRYDRNIFTFDSSGIDVKRQPTDFINTHITGEYEYQLSPLWTMGTAIWFQNSRRNIINDTIYYVGDQKQDDKNLRANIFIGFQKNKHRLKWSTSYSNESLSYDVTNVTFPYGSQAKIEALQQSLHYYYGDKSPLHIFIRHRLDVASANFFEKIQKRNTSQFGASWSHFWTQNLFMQLSGRQDVVDGKFVNPSLHALFEVKGYKLAVYNNYQLPNFNDLFYPFSGNPDLKPERAMSIDLSKNFTWSKSSLNIELFNHWIQNLIQWVPIDSSGFIWSPLNQQNVLSRGIDVRFASSIQIRKGLLQYQIGYGFTDVTIQKHKTVETIIGKQLIFMPRHKARFGLSYTWNKHTLSDEILFIGQRFLTADNSASLPKVWLNNLTYRFKIEPWTFTFSIQNLTNQKYQWVHGFPMPTRNFEASIQFALR